MNTIINCLLPIKFGFIVVDESSLVEVPSLLKKKQTGKYRYCLCIICFTMQHIKFLIEINADLLMRNFSVTLCLLKCLHSFLGLGISSCINTNILFCIYHHDVFSPSLFNIFTNLLLAGIDIILALSFDLHVHTSDKT
uniref:Uncharacterized protein n=1 Tax=Octopus bimaculoides TaxID=37653 RepID=A0A0L8FX75_OCTBM